MKRLIFFYLFLLICFSKISAQYKIAGKIFDQNKNPLPGAVITLNNKHYTSSDALGYFSFKNLKKGEYLLKIQYIGFTQVTKKINLKNDVFLNIQMTPNNQNELDQVIVSSVRTNNKSPFVYTNIQRKEIQQNNIGQDIPFILKTTPSIVINSDAGNGVGYTSMTIRGTDITRINVTINGVPLNDPESHGVWWVDIPDLASSINSIQIQRGVGTSTNGAGAFGASINLKTNSISKNPYTILSNSYGSFNTYKNTINIGSGTLGKHFVFNARLSREHSDGYIDRAWANLKSFYLSGTYFDKNTIIKAIVFSGFEETYQAWNGVPKDSLKTHRTYNLYTYDNQIDHYIQTHYQIHIVRKINNNFKFNLASFFIKGGGYYEQYKKNQNYSDYGLKNVIINNDTITKTNLIRRKWLDNDFFGLNYNLFYTSSNLNITLGGSWNKYIGYHFGRIIWMQYAQNTPIRYQWYKNLGLKYDFDTYLKTNYSINSNLNLYSDIQYRIVNYTISGSDDDLSLLNQTHPYKFFNPKLGLNLKINNNSRIYTSFAIANREPKRSDFIDAPANKIPKSEKLMDYELGYNISSHKFSFQANLYYMDYKNQLILTGKINDVGAPIVTNAPKSFRRGIELAAGAELTSFLSWNANLTLSQNKILNFTEYVDNWNYWDDPKNQPMQYSHYLGTTDISFSPNIIASNILTLKISKYLNINLISKYVGRQFIDNTSSIERSLDPYFVSDAQISTSFSTKFIKNIQLKLRINNIFNKMYETNAWVYSYYYNGQRLEENGYFPQAGTNFLLNLFIKF
jgi:iron complex outermembrane receptor protein